MKKKYFLGLALLIPTILSACSSGSKSNSSNLKTTYKDYFKIGAAINKTTRESELLGEFNSFTAENDMKWKALHPTMEEYTWDNADKYIQVAKQQKAGVRGHALVWHDAIPEAVFVKEDNTPRTKDEILEIEKDHIKTVIEHFGDSVYCWDVCNEVVDDNPNSELKEDGSNIYRESEWYKTCGKDYIKVAFETADKTLRDLGIRDKVQLVYNDYSNTTPVKRAKTVAMLNWLKSENVPIDAIGLQCHYHLGNFNMKELDESIEIYANLGLDVQITEFDVEIYDTNSEAFSSQNFKTFSSVPKANTNMQASIYDRALEICRKHASQISSVTFWGVTDSSCYMNTPMAGNDHFGEKTNYPFLFDLQNRKKQCYYAINEFGKYLNHTYNPYEDSVAENIYNNDGKDFYINTFNTDNRQIVSRPALQQDGSYKVSYTNVSGYNYVGTNVCGRLADFTYINILAKGEPGKSIALRLFHSDKEMESNNVLGDDVSFTLEEEFTIHTLKVKYDYQSRMDILTRVCIYPELGIGGAYGDFYYKDVWFSKEVPENSVLENPGVDTGDTSKTVNGWSYESWTGYTLYKHLNGTAVNYVEAKDYAFISYSLDIKGPEDNALLFAFENIVENEKQTVSHIRFLLRGDVIGQGVSPEGYDYDIFIEDVIYTFDITKDHETPDQNNITTLKIPLADAISTIGNRHETGYKLTVMIESFEPDREIWDSSRYGQMVITDCHLYDGSYVSDVYSQPEDSEGFQYTLSDKAGVDKNITYENLRGDKYWPVIYRQVQSTHDQQIVVRIQNNGENSVQVMVHAGILYDSRADEHNHFFYPLWQAHQGEKNDDGYYIDGERQTILPGEYYDFLITVDEDEMYKNDAIDTLEFLIDNVYNDKVLRSGNVDIVFTEVQDRN